jgi:trehalose 6-phosphate synthase/phosphatase
MKKRIVIVSNRLPVTIEKKKGDFKYKQSVGGLATGLGSFYRSYHSIWAGWCGLTGESVNEEEKSAIQDVLVNRYNCVSLFLTKTEVKMFYHGFCNKTIWPLFHYFTNYTSFDKSLWESYRKVNEKFYRAVKDIVLDDDIIWIQDYQLMLLPQLLRAKFPRISIGFFLHIPFPSFEIFRLLPWRTEILEGLMGADVVGFHTYDYVRHFLSSVRRLLGYEHTMGQIYTSDHIVRADAFPMGIDFQRYASAPENVKVKKEIKKIRDQVGKSKVILSVDRLDYTKGIIERLMAYERFLSDNPDYEGKVTLILVVVPSRTGVETYMRIKEELDKLIGRINGEHGRIGWVPVLYLYKSLPFHVLTALYCTADVALITPLRDGMNLIAKEYVAAKTSCTGVLVLSGMAGAAQELGEALIVNPNNLEQVVGALKTALEMPEEEQIERINIMQKRIESYNIRRWAGDFIERLSSVHDSQEMFYERMLTPALKEKLLKDYGEAENRLILMAYDGTLKHFSDRPGRAKPDREISDLLKRLVEDPCNETVITSGRKKEILTEWFGHLNINLVAEHGVWIREKGDEWGEIEPLVQEWKDEIRPILQLYADRTPGTFIEEKDYSLGWHYRRADPDLVSVRINELKETILNLIVNLNLSILEGNKVLEVKNSEINKGRAVLNWLSREKWNFILAFGDDVTDEDLFNVLPEISYSFKVGLGVSQAKYNVAGVYEVRALLHELSA